MSVFVVKAVDDQQPSQPVPGVFEELAAGRARIGWSRRDRQDLRIIRDLRERGEQLDGHQQSAVRCLGFLTRVHVDDYLVYPHQPERGMFAVVQVTEEDYDYSNEDAGLNRDFRSFRPCALITPEPVDLYDEIVPAQLRYRLGRPGRFSKIYDPHPLTLVLNELQDQGERQDGSNSTRLGRIYKELRKGLPQALRREFSQADLSRRFCPELFDRMGFSSDVQEGPGEAGSDVIVTVGNALLPTEFRIGVQAFAYEGEVGESELRKKLDQLLSGWDTNSLKYGVLLTTGRCSDAARNVLRSHNGQVRNRQIQLVEGNDLADLFLQYFSPGDE